MLAQGSGAVVAHAGNHIDFFHENPCAVFGDKITGGVIEGVARSPSHAQQLGLGLLVGSDAGKVLIAKLVDLAGHHHHMAPGGPNDIVEEESEGHPSALDRFFLHRAAHWENRFDSRRDAVGHEKIRGEGQLGQSATHGWGCPKCAHQDFAVIPEGFRDGDGTDFGTGYFTHRFFTAAW